VPGATLDPATGVISIVGNTGLANDLRFETSSFAQVRGGVTRSTGWFSPVREATADGESVRTQFEVFDSLGARVPVELTFTLVSKDPQGGSTWRYDARSSADTDDPRLTSGTIRFDDIGRPVGDLTFPLTINRAGSAARDPLVISVELNQSVSAFNSTGNGTTAGPSEIRVRGVDGTAVGTLSSFAIGSNGIISGAFDNGETRVLGQLALAMFSNPQGLIDAGNNLFKVGANSGEPLIVNPGSFGSGTTSGGALELSNVDLSAEFINLILTSTGYSANSRVISSADQLLQQLLVVGR
jgi:flagellar hook protein FlgE